MRAARSAAVAAAALLGGVAVVQAGAAAGAPVGAHLYGGRAAHVDGVLPAGHRVASGGAALLLLGLAVLLLVRAGLLRAPLPPAATGRATWLLVVLMAASTVANAASTSAVERWGMGSVTAAVALLAAVVARSPLPDARAVGVPDGR
ncbi:hypothetical protein WDV85_12035 [Pseudokineococcus sp. 5B2Z-1]|uniref:hypothetical protein n=1 Tax=Pseudokineococcus sp. 5B2Z-1 TaxID=3132744 RepID=UPI0030A05510